MHTRVKKSPGDSSSKCSLREFIRTLPKEKEKGMKNLHSTILNLNEKLGNLANQLINDRFWLNKERRT